MGTSKDVGGAKSPEWSRLRRRATQFAKDGGGREAAAGLVAGFVAALGGAAAALASSPATTRSGQALAGFLSGVAHEGPTPTLEDLGLGSLADCPRDEVISGLADRFAGSGATLEEAAARKALIDVLDDVIPEDGSLDDVQMDATALESALRLFLAYTVYYRLDAWIADRIAKLADPADQQGMEREIRSYIVDATRLDLTGVDVLHVDWASPAGRQLMERIEGRILADLEGNVP
jgi:hypothetical protein